MSKRKEIHQNYCKYVLELNEQNKGYSIPSPQKHKARLKSYTFCHFMYLWKKQKQKTLNFSLAVSKCFCVFSLFIIQSERGCTTRPHRCWDESH